MNPEPKGTRSTWTTWQRLVLYRIEESSKQIQGLEGRLRKIEIRAGAFGVASGVIAAAVSQLRC